MDIVTLSDCIRTCTPLNDVQIAHLVRLIGKHCRKEVVHRIERRLKFAHIQQDYGIYGRVHVYPEVRYVAGQSYPDEIRTIRKCLLG